jgi:hypothetical protein
VINTIQMLNNAKHCQDRLAWMARDNPNVISTRIYRGDLNEAAANLDKFAASKNLNIVEVVRIAKYGIDFAFGRGA